MTDTKEIKMLTDKIVKMVVDFDEYEYPERWMSAEDTLMHWEMSGVNVWYKSEILNEDEQKRLEIFLTENQNIETYTDLRIVIEWILSDFPFSGWDCKDDLIFGDQHSHYINGEEPKVDWFSDPMCKLSFYRTYGEIQKFEGLVPHYRNLLREHLN